MSGSDDFIDSSSRYTSLIFHDTFCECRPKTSNVATAQCADPDHGCLTNEMQSVSYLPKNTPAKPSKAQIATTTKASKSGLSITLQLTRGASSFAGLAQATAGTA